MMKFRTYAGLSFFVTLTLIYHAFNSRGQFYPAMVYLSTSKGGQVLLLNMSIVFMCILWQLARKVFLGSLREAEVERLNEQARREVLEVLFALNIFRQGFSVMFLAMVTALLLIKALHWLAQKRVEYIETSPSLPMLSHIRIVSFTGFLLLVDSFFLYNSVKHLTLTRRASVSLFFSFEYMILATTTVATFVKYVFYVRDMLMEGQWERKVVYTFYLELIRDLLHLSLYMCFFLVIFVTYGVPLLLIREFYETFRNLKMRVADYIRYRKLTSNMNERFPNATPEELNASDATCIICREEMTTAKKLICGHLFHVHCLRSWLERQHRCPTCRALVVARENGENTTASLADIHQEGTSTASTSSRGSTSDSVANSNMNISPHQARLQAAAAAAASTYEKSYVYPSANTIVWSHGYGSLPRAYRSVPDFTSTTCGGEHVSTGQTRPRNFSIVGGPENMPFSQFPHCSFIPFQALMKYGDRLSSNPSVSESQSQARKKVIQSQIEVLQNQLELLQKPTAEKIMEKCPTAASDCKGSISEYCSSHRKTEERDS